MVANRKKYSRRAKGVSKYIHKLKRRFKYRIKRSSVAMAFFIVMALVAAFYPVVESDNDRNFNQENVSIKQFSGMVTKVIDGDTFRIKGQSLKIRVWGLDAPEMDTSEGIDAAREMKRLIQGENLNCYRKTFDRYGRIVAICSLSDGRDIAEEMIFSGAATEYCYFSNNAYGSC